MKKVSLTLALVAVNVVALLTGTAAAQDHGKLGPQDYIDIRQLIDGYSRSG